jgi:hypothetical protein
MNTNTATRTAAAATVRDAFRYWDAVPALVEHTDESALRRDYENQGGQAHWFDADTLRFFGSRNRELVRPGLMVELQANAPEGVERYAVHAWVLDPTRDNRVTPQLVARFTTRRAAAAFAADAADVWPSLVGSAR